jgi:23S rRNA pseudouridine2457 synthase
MPTVVLFHKPYGVLCQFTAQSGRPCLADYVSVPRVYPAGRLDTDSEGLLVLTDDGPLQARIADPSHKLPKRYWAQVEGAPTEAALSRLRAGVELDGILTKPAEAKLIAAPESLWERQPPIRVRQTIPTSWLELVLREGKNRQVRRMTAAVGYPTLRLIRAAVGPWTLAGLKPGEWRRTSVSLE